MCSGMIAEAWKNSRSEGSALLVLLALADNVAREHSVGFVSFDIILKKARLKYGDGVKVLEELRQIGEIDYHFDEDELIVGIYTNESDGAIQARKKNFAKMLPQVKPLAKLEDGYVYILKSASGHYKIGRTKYPADRIKTFGVKLPFEVEYELLIFSHYYKTLEKQLHHRYADQHVDGEWFDLTEQDITDLREEFDSG